MAFGQHAAEFGQHVGRRPNLAPNWRILDKLGKGSRNDYGNIDNWPRLTRHSAKVYELRDTLVEHDQLLVENGQNVADLGQVRSNPADFLRKGSSVQPFDRFIELDARGPAEDSLRFPKLPSMVFVDSERVFGKMVQRRSKSLQV